MRPQQEGRYMPYWWWILPALAGLLALGLLAGSISALARHKPYRALGGIFTGGALLALAAIVLLLGLDIQTYSRLTYERTDARAMTQTVFIVRPANGQAMQAICG
jgi:hypothetical protein